MKMIESVEYLYKKSPMASQRLVFWPVPKHRWAGWTAQFRFGSKEPLGWVNRSDPGESVRTWWTGPWLFGPVLVVFSGGFTVPATFFPAVLHFRGSKVVANGSGSEMVSSGSGPVWFWVTRSLAITKYIHSSQTKTYSFFHQIWKGRIQKNLQGLKPQTQIFLPLSLL